MIVITSAAYVDSEHQAEFGRLPPSMLPLGNRRLFERQMEVLRQRFPKEPAFLSLPDSYQIVARDIDTIAGCGIEVVRVPEGLNLAGSVLFVLDHIGQTRGGLKILHGDTLVFDIPDGDDVIGVATTHDDYDWKVEHVDDGSEQVWCGYFAFSDVARLKQCFAASEGRFVHAIQRYEQSVAVRRALVRDWCDLGHVNTYFKSRARMSTARPFNKLLFDDGCVIKTGAPAEKIAAESWWFKNLPVPLRRFIPQLIDAGLMEDGSPYYVLEQLCLYPLNELFVFGLNPIFFWDRIFERCDEFLLRCRKLDETLSPSELETVEADSARMVRDKTLARLDAYAAESRVDLQKPVRFNERQLPSLYEIADSCAKAVLARPAVAGVLHGDLCFSNILYDSRADSIKVVDPRATNYSGTRSMHGDLRYDVAKLTHSVVGMYDFILAGHCRCRKLGTLQYSFELPIDTRIREIQRIFLSRHFLGTISPKDLLPLTVLLFLSMLPLHADMPDRQDALLANALRLYAENIVETH